MNKFRLFVSHAQLAVFRSDLQNPFNDWIDQHVAQGFAWRPGSVSFRSLVESGMHSVSVEIVDRLCSLDAAVVRAIDVPFDVPESGCIEVSSISDSIPLALAPGSYLLRCEFHAPGLDGNEHVRLVFSKGDPVGFSITRADPDLDAGKELLTTAEQAPT